MNKSEHQNAVLSFEKKSILSSNFIGQPSQKETFSDFHHSNTLLKPFRLSDLT